MKNDENNGPIGGPEGKWKGKKRRDDTPSFIRNVAARAEMLNPVRPGESIPVLTMPASVRLWRKIRWPLFVSIILILLIVVGFVTNDRLVARSVANRISEARDNEAASTIVRLVQNDETLGALADRHSGRMNAQVAFAWNSMLLAEMFGPKQKYMEKAAASLKSISSYGSAMAYAARAAEKYHNGDFPGGLKIVLQGLKKHPNEPRLQLVRSWILFASGKSEEAFDVLDVVREGFGDYLPALHTSLSFALKEENNEAVKIYSEDLLIRSPGSILGSLASVSERLPGWYGEALDPSQILSLVKDMDTMSGQMSSMPQKIAMQGRFLAGRVNLLAGRLDKASEDLRYVSEADRDPRLLAWYAMAVRRLNGPRAALDILDAKGESTCAEIHDLRARCLLDYHLVDQAGASLEKLGSDLDAVGDVRELKWILAVRRADLDEAKKFVPDKIGEQLMWVGLEMFELYRSRGDREGIDALTEKFVGNATGCVPGIRAWTGGKLSNVTKVLSKVSEDTHPCTCALISRLMRGHLPLPEVKKAAQRAVAEAGGELRPRIDQALAIWLVDGRKAALGVIADVRKNKPEGALIRIAMADAYMLMDVPAEVLSVLDGLDNPEAVSLRIAALQKTGDKAGAEKALAAALSDEKAKDHPAIVLWKLSAQLEASEYDKVILGADEAHGSAGTRTAEIAELKAKALNAMGSRGDADRWLLSAAKSARTNVGFGESWQAKIALIRLNLRRGGNFLFKAVGVTLELYKAGVKDAELSYSYAVANIRQGNERGAMRYLREAVELDPSFTPPYSQLQLLGKLPQDYLAVLERTRPGTTLE